MSEVGAMKLPDKLSELLKLAIKDLLETEKDKRYSVDMDSWHEYDPRANVCYVCLAGAVITQTIKLDFTTQCNLIHPHYDIPGIETNIDQLLAINSARLGEINQAISLLGNNTKFGDRDITDYHVNRESFLSDMYGLIDDLEKAGL